MIPEETIIPEEGDAQGVVESGISEQALAWQEEEGQQSA